MAFSFGSNIVTSGLVMYLDAGNVKSYPGSGSTWANMIDQGNDATLYNTPTYSGDNGGSFTFNGSNNYALFTRPASIVTAGSISISMWVRWTTVGTTISNIQALVDNNHAINQGFIIQDRPDLSKVLNFAANPSVGGVTSTFQVGTGVWRHIVATNNGTTSTLYIDGVYNNQAAETMSTVQPNISIGYWQGGTRFLNGNVSLVKIYNRALTASEVTQNFNAHRGRYGI